MITIIVAMDKNLGIGYKNTLPFKDKEELGIFQKLTMIENSYLIMGSKTYDSLPNKNLKGRQIIVLSSNTDKYKDKNVIMFNKINSLKSFMESNSEWNFFICGGEQIYNLFLQDYSYQKVLISYFYDKELRCDTFFNCKQIKKFLNKDYEIYEGKQFRTYMVSMNEIKKNLKLCGDEKRIITVNR